MDGEAREVSDRSFQYMNENEGKQLICDEAAVRSDLFYHRKCYQKLTNKGVIEMAEKRVRSKEKTSEKKQTNLKENHAETLPVHEHQALQRLKRKVLEYSHAYVSHVKRKNYTTITR